MSNQTSNKTTRVYLDHAATSWPKLDAVLFAMDSFTRSCGATAGRGGYKSSLSAGAIVAQTRRQIASIINAESPECISFHSGGTAALNAAIHGILRPGDHVVTSAAEHNSVLRPLNHWQQRRDADITIVPTDGGGLVDADRLISAVTDRTRLVVLTSASNVTGAVQPIDEVGKKLASHSAFFLCDAAQTFGTLPIDVRQSHIDLLAAPGHKSSGGPAGTAFLYLSPRVHHEMIALTQGGTGSQSESLEMPAMMPTMMEAGSLNVPAIAGWLEALKLITPDELARRIDRAASICSQLHQGLRSIDGLTLHSTASELPIASVTSRTYLPSDLSMILDSEYSIETRAGLHCAALIHDCIASAGSGTLRISAGHSSTDDDIEAVIAALRQIMSS